MKKLASLFLMILIVTLMIGTVNAALSCNVNLITSKMQYNKKEQVSIDINLSNIQTERGIIAFGGTLEYDTDSLKLIKMEGKNSWSNPSYNETNGKLIMDRANPSTNNNETILTITFEVKENSKQSVSIKLNNVEVANGIDTPININTIKKDISVIEGSTAQSINNTMENKNNNLLNNTSSANLKLPKAGSSNVISLGIIGFFIVIAIVVYVKMKKIK